MKGEVTWTGEGGYVGTTAAGKVFGIYGESSPSPMEMVMHAHAACSLIDVIDGLKDRIGNVEFATVDIETERAEESPRVFTSVCMNYKIKGDVPEELVRRLIETSHEKFCSVGIMITRAGSSLEWTLEMV
ncbi:MAG: OsmC family protein [Candidatus Thermoplasmatota archaeon]|nr:OsmC family protein [Candidatus Thermoplasmatota archaeon]